MITRIILTILLVLSLLIEGTFISFPFVFIVASILFMLYPDFFTLTLVFLAGIIIDSLRGGQIGLTPFVIFILLLFISSDIWIFSLKNSVTVVTILFLVTLIYSIILSYPFNIFLYISIFTILLFLLIFRNLRTVQIREPQL